MKISALILGVSLILSAITISYTILEVKESERVVAVKGLAEKEVKADIAIFPVVFSLKGNSLKYLLSDLRMKSGIVYDFLIEQGFSKDEIEISLPRITDNHEYNYNSKTEKFTTSITLNVYTKKVDLVRTTRNKLEILSENDIYVSNSWVQYLFRGLNEIKPEMIEQATKNGREVAERFAKDSGSKLGKIKTAYQGQFSISDRDSNTPYLKRVRVVSTIEYYLED